MEIKDIENKLAELRAKQGDVFKKKKADRDTSVLEGIRSEMADLKKQAKESYENRKKEKRAEDHLKRQEATRARVANKK